MKDGAFSLDNICMGIIFEERIQQVDYIAKGDVVEYFCPMFTIFGVITSITHKKRNGRMAIIGSPEEYLYSCFCRFL